MSPADGSLDAGGLVKSVSIENLLAQREHVRTKVAQAIATLRDAASICDSTGFAVSEYRGFGWMLEPDHRYRTCLLEPDSLEGFMKRLDAGAWGHLMRESGLLTFMDAKAREKWRESIDNCKTPPLTLENITATFQQLYAARSDMFDRGVIECFKSLSWHYKTNNPIKFGKRIVKNIGSYWHSYRSDELNDLQRVFCILDGKPEEDHRNCLVTRLESAKRGANGGTVLRGEIDDTYVHIRWFKNGNGHITFKRPDLVDKLNAIISKHYPDALPEPPPP